jgi:hypothetical protein
LYTGWNDFQTYDPFRQPPVSSWFVDTYGAGINLDSGPIRSLALATALFRKLIGSSGGSGLALVDSNDSSGSANERRIAALREGEGLLLDSSVLDSAKWESWRVDTKAIQGLRRVDDATAYRLIERDSERNTRSIFQSFQFRQGEQYALSVLVKPVSSDGSGSPVERDIALAVDSHGGAVNIVVEFDFEAGRVAKRFGRADGAGVDAVGDGWYLVWVYWRSPADEPATVHIQLSKPQVGRIYEGEGGKAVEVAAPRLQRLDPSMSDFEHLFAATPEETYTFFLASLDRIVTAYRSQDPNTRIAISTLVGRWPHLSEEEYASARGRVWWMQEQSVDQKTAARALTRFNDLIRGYARQKGLLLLDPAEGLAGLDLDLVFDSDGKFSDFMHMYGDRYELLSEYFYEALRSKGIVNGAPSPRLSELRARYAGTVSKH